MLRRIDKVNLLLGEAGKLLDKILSLIELKEKKIFTLQIFYIGDLLEIELQIAKKFLLCLESTVEHIKIIKPKLLILVGGIAAKSLLNSKDGITKLRGINHYYCYDDNESKVHTRAIFHPAYLLRNPIEKKKNVG